ncbi:MAG TPA: DegV family protein [Candidatus Eisenbacteria bacterium]|nr:DegV family protein [Candidatus Eisenbacteria bacterium]
MARAFRVVTDSTSDVPPEWCERYGIEVVPLRVLFGHESFRDRIELSVDQFFARLRQADRLPTTSAPSPGDFAEVYRRLSRECEGVVSIHISGELSGTVEAARVGAASVEGFPVHVIDSRCLTICVAYLCRVAAEAGTLEEAVRGVEERIPKQRILALLDTLKYLEMGGRIGRAQALLGSMLDVKPILGMADGKVVPLDRVRTRAKAISRLLERLREDLPVERLAVMHAQAPEDAEGIRARLAADLPAVEVEVGEIGAVLGTHVGPGAVGLTYIKR